MKVPCTVSHEQPLENGGFKIYEAGKSYEVENPDPKYFDIVAEPQTKTAVETEKIEDPFSSANPPECGPIRKNKNKGGYDR